MYLLGDLMMENNYLDQVPGIVVYLTFGGMNWNQLGSNFTETNKLLKAIPHLWSMFTKCGKPIAGANDGWIDGTNAERRHDLRSILVFGTIYEK